MKSLPSTLILSRSNNFEYMGERFKVKFAVYLLVRDGEKILMLKRANTGYQDGNYGLVQGHVDGGETVQEAIMREAKEEAGIDVALEDVDVVHVQHSPAQDEPGAEYVCVFMEAKKWSGVVVNGEPEKCDEVSWFPLDQLPENTIVPVRAALEHIKEKVFYSNWGWER